MRAVERVAPLSQRTRAGLLALCLLAVLWGTAAFAPLPYVTYYPGPTVDILAAPDGAETVKVTGHRAFYDDGELRMTTVYVSQPEDDVTLPELLRAYFDDDAAVWPRSSIYAPDETDESSDRESAVAMVSNCAVASWMLCATSAQASAVDCPSSPGKSELRDVGLAAGPAGEAVHAVSPKSAVRAIVAAASLRDTSSSLCNGFVNTPFKLRERVA